MNMNVNTPIDPRMARARMHVVFNHPFFGSLLMHLKIVEANILTMDVDGKTLRYRKAFLDTLTQRQIEGVLVHEVMHCALKHHLRRGGRDLETWNVAGDHVINIKLLKKTVPPIELPDSALCDEQFTGLSTEEVYNLLERQNQQKQEEGKNKDGEKQEGGEGAGCSDEDEKGEDKSDKSDGDSGQDQDKSSDSDADDPEGGSPDDGNDRDLDNETSSGAGADSDCNPDPGHCGGVRDAAATEAELADLETEWDIAVSQAIGVAKRAGNLPGIGREIIDGINNPKQDWRAVLRRFIDPSSRKDYSWSKPNRRFSTSPYVLPGTVTDGVNHVGVVIDDSLSINIPVLKKFLSELQGALDEGGVDQFTVIFCDTQVHNDRQYVTGDQIELLPVHRGGTLFQPAFKWLEDNTVGLSGIVYFTDLMAGDWQKLKDDPPAVPVLWAVFGDPRYTRTYAPIASAFGECIELD